MIKKNQKNMEENLVLDSKTPMKNSVLLNNNLLPRNVEKHSLRYFPPAIRVWFNSVYSFNKSFIRSIPLADNLVFKIIKNYFTINLISDNERGKKSRLLIRRFKKLSLNRIIVSKPEIKHTGDKVNITLYVFNKKKHSFMNKIKQLYFDIMQDNNSKTENFVAFPNKNNAFKPKNLLNHKAEISLPVKSKQENNLMENTKNFNNISRKKLLLNSLTQKNHNMLNSAYYNVKIQFLLDQDREYSRSFRSFNYKKKTLYIVMKRNLQFYKYTQFNVVWSKFLFLVLRENNINRNNFFKTKNLIKQSNLASNFTPKNVENVENVTLLKSNKFNTAGLTAIYTKFITRKNLAFKPIAKYLVIKLLKLRPRVKTFQRKLNLKIYNSFSHINLKKRLSLFDIYKAKVIAQAKIRDNKYNNTTMSKNTEKFISYSNNNKLNLLNKKNHNSYKPNELNMIYVNGLKAIKKYKKHQTKYLLNTKIFNNNYNNILRNKYNILNKYKILSNIKPSTQNTIDIAKPITFGLNSNGIYFNPNSILNNSLYKLKSLSVLFALYKKYNNSNNYDLLIKPQGSNSYLHNNINNNNNLKDYYISLIAYTYKLLKKPIHSNMALKHNEDFSIQGHTSSYWLQNLLAFCTNNKLLNINISNKDINKKDVISNNLLYKYVIYNSLAKGSMLRVILRNKKDNNLHNIFIDTSNKPENSLNKDLYKNYINPEFKNLVNKKQGLAKLAKKNLPQKKNKYNMPLGKTIYKAIMFNNINAKFGMKTDNIANIFSNNLKFYYIINIFNKIDKIFNSKQTSLAFNHIKNSENTKNTIIGNQPSLGFKLIWLSELLDREILYISYLRSLSINNIIFKTGFINTLCNIISKIYNKKVILNVVSLKYIYFNSDILSQAISTRLKNRRINTIYKVFRKVTSLIALGKVNEYSYSMLSPIYKNLETFSNRYLGLRNNLHFINKTNVNTWHSKDISVNNSYPTSLKQKANHEANLNHDIYNTINFIKCKSVFGIKLQAKGRLTKRSTASRKILKVKYLGNLRYNDIINRDNTSFIVKNNRISNIQFTRIAGKTRIGSFGVKGWINNN